MVSGYEILQAAHHDKKLEVFRRAFFEASGDDNEDGVSKSVFRRAKAHL